MGTNFYDGEHCLAQEVGFKTPQERTLRLLASMTVSERWLALLAVAREIARRRAVNVMWPGTYGKRRKHKPTPRCEAEQP